MSVPLDRLYHYLADVVNHDLVIYRWLPHGSRKLEDFNPLNDYTKDEYLNQPVVICHDQEPLNYDFYSQTQIRDFFKSQLIKYSNNKWPLLKDSVLDYVAGLHLRAFASWANQHDLAILVHSEQHSPQIERFQQKGFVPVYYWSHGIIARDWFRYAEHDPILKFNPAQIKKDFLIYNRAWSSTREYRLCFAEQILAQGLDQHCKMSFNACDNQHYHQHQFVNPEFQISNFELEKYFPTNNHSANASADYCGNDYATTGIEVVLETLFDDPRWHLTEKALRPIACGRPFMLMATAGSLQYLRQYGFQTFAGLIDESYDEIQNPRQRLQAVIKEMTRISSLPLQDKIQLFQALDQIADQNKHYFFNGFFDQIQQEYVVNMTHAITTVRQHCTRKHHRTISELMK
jgi:hypothetical protein